MKNNNGTTTKTILAALAVILCGLVIGGVAGFVSFTWYVLVLFPIGVGLVSGFILSKLSPAWNRKPLPGILLGLLAACVLYGAFHAANYGMSRTYLTADMALSMKEAGSEPDLELAGLLLDGILVEQTGHLGFTGFILLKAEYGGMLDTLLADLDIAPSPLFAWGYWLLELAIIAWLTVRGAYRRPARPALVPAAAEG